MAGLRDLPLTVLLTGVTAAAMLVPAVHALAIGDARVAGAFLAAAGAVGVLAGMVALALANRPRGHSPRAQLADLGLAYLILPVAAAVPFALAVPDTRFLNAWFEMVAAFTTTGGTLYDAPGRLPMSVHLWRGLVAWGGGFFVLAAAAAILAPMNLGGYEVLARGSARPDRPAAPRGAPRGGAGERVAREAAALFPAFAVVTLALWVGLIAAGEGGTVALVHAMGTISTTAVSPVLGIEGGAAGLAGEALVFAGLCLAVTRRALPGAPRRDGAGPLWRDPEVRLAAGIVAAVPAALFLRHWLGAVDNELPDDFAAAGLALWGAVFTVLSFLTTTGYESAGWAAARVWSGLETPGLILMGLAMIGGGVATTAGGVRLLRVHALAAHAGREFDRMSHPSSVGGGGPAARSLRREGASFAFVTFMMFALTFGALTAALTLTGEGFERALALAVAALTTTGPLADLGIAGGEGYANLTDAAKAVLAAGMVLGRLELLALLALLAPGAWRR